MKKWNHLFKINLNYLSFIFLILLLIIFIKQLVKNDINFRPNLKLNNIIQTKCLNHAVYCKVTTVKYGVI